MDSIVRKTFGKTERIFLRKEIKTLFKEGVSFKIDPLRIVYLEKEITSEVPASILVIVPKKHCKQAVKRNKIKRWIREAYRLHKNILYKFSTKKYKTLQIAFIFAHSCVPCYSNVEAGVVGALRLVVEKISCHENI